MPKKKRHVLITTQYRGVYQGELVSNDPVNRSCVLENANMVIKWGTSDGVDQLANTGPTSNSKIAAMAPKIELYGLTSLVDCSPKAVKAWKKYKNLG
jgi:hypothetical protein